MSDDAVRVETVKARLLDASLLVSGTWSGWRGGGGSLEAAADAEAGPEAIRWGWDRASLPPQFRPAAPIAARDVRLTLAGGGALTLDGGFVVANGPHLTLDLARTAGRTEVRDLTIADGDTRASLALLRPDGAFDVAFRGTLDVTTFGKLFEGRPERRGRIEGELRALVPAENPAALTAEGALTAADLDVPTPAGTVTVERLEARAAKNRLDVASSSLVLDEQRFSVAGSATLRDEAVALDLDVSAGDLPWARVEKVLGRLEDSKKNTAAPAPPDGAKAPDAAPRESMPAIRGEIRVSLESFSYGSLVWKPVLADVRFGKDAVAAGVRKADVCGISTTGEARFLPGGDMAVDARVESAGPDINVPLTCLGLENVGMTGGYEASAQVKGDGPASGMPRAVRGLLTFKAVKGRIGKATLLTRILGVLNATDVFAGKSGSRVGEAMPFDSITVVGEVGDGDVLIREATFVAPSITMAATGTVGLLDQSLDLVVLAHPLSTVDKVVQAVPVVNTILGRNFLAVAVKVTGSLGDPKVGITPGGTSERGSLASSRGR